MPRQNVFRLQLNSKLMQTILRNHNHVNRWRKIKVKIGKVMVVILKKMLQMNESLLGFNWTSKTIKMISKKEELRINKGVNYAGQRANFISLTLNYVKTKYQEKPLVTSMMLNLLIIENHKSYKSTLYA
jgi:hypothetical protein